jgi:hypothetical protein
MAFEISPGEYTLSQLMEAVGNIYTQKAQRGAPPERRCLQAPDMPPGWLRAQVLGQAPPRVAASASGIFAASPPQTERKVRSRLCGFALHGRRFCSRMPACARTRQGAS